MRRVSGLVKNPTLCLLFALLAAAAMKVWLVVGGWVPFNADEAVVALMARHILRGARPVFFYGQAYMGSLDAFLVAAAFGVVGEQVWAIRLVQGLLYLVFLITTFWLGKAVFGKPQVGALGALILAVPVVNLSLYTTASLGGYGEALVIGNLILLCALKIRGHWAEGDFPGPSGWWVLFGLLSGLGLWAFGLTLVYSLPAAVFLFFLGWDQARSKKLPPPGRLAASLIGVLAGALLGSAPWWIYALQNGFAKLVGELSGGAIAGVEGLPWVVQVGRHLVSLLLFGGTVVFGLRPPWSVSWLGLPLLPFVLIFWLAVFVAAVRTMRSSPWHAGPLLLGGVMGTLAVVFVFSPFGADPSGRYFLPLAAPLALFAAHLILSLQSRLGAWAFSLVALLIVYQFWGTLQSALAFPPGITTQFYGPTQVDHRYDPALIDFLRSHQETRGYSNYWTAYPLAFLSQEQLIFTPRLPYHPDFRYTARDDRYAPYDDLVAASAQAAYITTLHPDLDAYLRKSFSSLGVSWQEALIGDYRVFYRLSRPVRPGEIGLGETTAP